MFEGYGGYDGGKDSAFYLNPYFPRPSLKDERQDDLNRQQNIDNTLFWVTSSTLVILLIGSIALVSIQRRQ